MTKSKLNKEKVEQLGWNYSEAKRMGISNEDLIGIQKLSSGTYRTRRTVGNERISETHTDLLELIKINQRLSTLAKEKSTALKELKERTKENSNITDSETWTVAVAIEKYINYKENLLEQGIGQISTLEDDKATSKGRILIESDLLEKNIHEINKEEANDFVTFLRTYKKKDGSQLSENTIYTPFSLIHKVFNYLKDELEIIKTNHFSKTTNKPKAKIRKKEFYDDDEMLDFYKSLRFMNIRFKAFMLSILDTGSRREEVSPLKFSNVNPKTLVTTYEETFVFLKNSKKWIIKKFMKNDESKRQFILTWYAYEQIKNLRTFKEACGFKVNDNDPIFTQWDTMEIILPDTFTAELKKFCKNCNLKHIPLKNMRDTHVSFFSRRSKNIKAVQHRVGHKDYKTTADIYTQVNLKDDLDLVNTYENFFYHKLNLTVLEIFEIYTDQCKDEKKVINFLEDITGIFISDDNYHHALDITKDFLENNFPLFKKFKNIKLNSDELEAVFLGIETLYNSVKIEKEQLYHKFNNIEL